MRVFKKLKKWIGAIALGSLLIVGTVYSAQTGEIGKKQVVLVLKIIDENNDFWTSLMQGAQMAAKEYNVDVTIVGPDAEIAYQTQGQMIQQAISKQPDAIILAPSSYTETVAYAKEVEEARIPLVLVDSVMAQEMGMAVIATDNIEAGRKMGEYISQNYPEDVCIGVVAHVQGSSTATEREQGLREGLGSMENQIADVVFGDSDYEKSYEVTMDMLRRYPDINVIAGLNEYSAVGAARAVRDLGLSGKIRMIGFDSSLEEVEYLEDGTFDAIVMQKPLNMGYLCMEKTIQMLNKEKIPETIDSGSVLITKETMYTEENQKLLFPV